MSGLFRKTEGLPEEPRKTQFINESKTRATVSLSVSPNFIRAPFLVTYGISANFCFPLLFQ